ncbi:hypothetical protein DFH09DRAFT_1070085 [Mycena vulgaris]|nr:hypothetical protein DFH09DRAFT_1070085 [Mycena vulgaris]
MSTTPSRRSAPLSTLSSRDEPSISLREPQSFPPIYKNLPPITARDPFGLLSLRPCCSPTSPKTVRNSKMRREWMQKRPISKYRLKADELRALKEAFAWYQVNGVHVALPAESLKILALVRQVIEEWVDEN